MIAYAVALAVSMTGPLQLDRGSLYRVDATGEHIPVEIDFSHDPIAGFVATERSLLVVDELGRVFRDSGEEGGLVPSDRGLPVPLRRRTDRPLLAVDPGRSATFYLILRVPSSADHSQTVLFRSSDGGASWQARKELAGADFRALEVTRDGTAYPRLELRRADESSLVMSDRSALVEAGAALAVTATERRLPSLWAGNVPADFDTPGLAVLHDDGTFVATNDTSGRRLRFTPLPSGGYDARFVNARGVVPFGLDLGLYDDQVTMRALPFPFPFYSGTGTTLYVSDNGNVTFAPDAAPDAIESSELLSSGPPRIAVLWDDLAPGAVGRVYYDERPDLVTVTWFQMSQPGVTEHNAFQLMLEPNGVITIEWDINAVRDGLIGLSPGGGAARFYGDFTRDAPFDVLAGSAVYEQFVPDQINTARVMRRFYSCHPDLFQQIVLWAGSGYGDIAGGPQATTTIVSNNVRGIGLPTFTDVEEYGSANRLEAVLNMNPIAGYPADPGEGLRGSQSGLEAIAAEVGRRWAAYVRYDAGTTFTSTSLLGDGNGHWNFFLDSDASVLGGHDFRDDGGGRFTAVGVTSRYSALDQYLMGIRRAVDVAPFTLVTSLTDPGDCGGAPCTAASAPNQGVVIQGVPEVVSLGQVILAEGARIPSVGDTPMELTQGWVLVVPAAGIATASDLDKLESYRTQWESYFASATSNYASTVTYMIGSISTPGVVIGNELHAFRSSYDVMLDWENAARTPRRYVVHGTPNKSLLVDSDSGIVTTPVVGVVDGSERLADPAGMQTTTARPALFFYEVFERDCLDRAVIRP